MYSAVQAGGTDNRVMQYAPLVKRIAYHLLAKLPDSVLVEDLIQSGMIGLLEAIKNFDATQGASFETYASIRIRGAMLDEVRRSDWAPRSVHKKARMVTEAMRELERLNGREATDAEVAAHMGVSMAEYTQILQDSCSVHLFSVEELAETGDDYLDSVSGAHEQPFDDISREGFQHALAQAIMALPERERLVLSLYYDDELNLREIGEVLEVSESRVSQISTQAILRLRARLADWVEAN